MRTLIILAIVALTVGCGPERPQNNTPVPVYEWKLEIKYQNLSIDTMLIASPCDPMLESWENDWVVKTCWVHSKVHAVKVQSFRILSKKQLI